MEKIKCNRTVEYNTGLQFAYYKCDKKPFINVSYKSSTNSQIINEVLCKTHYNALVKNIARINKITGFESELKINAI